MTRDRTFRVLAGISLILVVVAGLLTGLVVLPVEARHVQQGEIPDGLALRIDLDPQVRLQVATTRTLGGSPRFEYRTTSLADPSANLVGWNTLTARCEVPDWTAWLGHGCTGELLVVVDRGRPVRLYYSPDGVVPQVAPDVFVEERHLVP